MVIICNGKVLDFQKKIKIIALLVIVTMIVVGCILWALSNQMSNDEKIVLENSKDLRQMLKDPDSFKLQEDILLLWYKDSEEGELEFYTYISYGAKNGYGAMDRDTAMYKGYTYVGDFEELENTEEEEKKQLLLHAQTPYLIYKAYNLIGKDENEISESGIKKAIWINKEKIMQKIK